ncbi:MAG: helix-turn-helix transcriptional regulator [Solirubrobacterales bacterium]|nr:helix-turn-helix transcriptional regulator [Solirubrobacterales bacterium]
MKHGELSEVYCSLARTWSVIGERWTMLIIREAFRGTRRFDTFQQRLGVGRNVLSNRLGRLTAEGIFDRVRYQQAPDRYEYRLTEKGTDLYPVLLMLMRWGDRYKVDEPPVRLYHKGCGGLASPELRCAHCGDLVDFHSMRAEYAPGAW